MNEERRTAWLMSDDTAATDDAVRVLATLSDLRLSEAKLLRRLTEQSGLKENDLAAMRLLRDSAKGDRPIGPKDLANRLGITSASVTVLLDRLEKRGLAARTPNPEDRRGLRLSVTEEGLNVVASHDDPELVSGVFAALGADDAQLLERFFRDLAAAAETIDPSDRR
ncbi:MarR family winged helix-turn-helix transcriptional regulator [Herbiconiux sp. P15]|uniref:MarR family winged helix-turn-helix transcriptional regulator n=1 Tax=Herbiconiux liukaitaii TaxID=3342799 RepID=UPI0035B850C4